MKENERRGSRTASGTVHRAVTRGEVTSFTRKISSFAESCTMTYFNTSKSFRLTSPTAANCLFSLKKISLFSRYYCEDNSTILFEKWFHCTDLGKDLVPIVKSYVLRLLFFYHLIDQERERERVCSIIDLSLITKILI